MKTKYFFITFILVALTFGSIGYRIGSEPKPTEHAYYKNDVLTVLTNISVVLFVPLCLMSLFYIKGGIKDD